MNEVKYYLNGSYFKDFGVYVSDSIGIADALERKPVQSYDWAEYHGISVDLSQPRYKERKIELKCFIEGENWEVLFENFKSFIREQFSKPGTQRLHIEPFGFKTLPYEVYMQGEIELDKTFKNGYMVGVFSLNLIEPNPIKKVLKTSLDQFHLSYEIDSETEIFFGDGTKQIGRGNVSLTKNYSSPSYQGSGFTLVQTSAINNEYYEIYTIPSDSQLYLFSVEAELTEPKSIILYVIGRKPSNIYEVVATSDAFQGRAGINSISTIHELNISDYGKFFLKVLDDEGHEIPGISFSNPRIETAEILGEWQDMLGKEKIIIIAGNIENMKNFSTEAEIIWDKI